ncbi:MAG: glycosyltransferase, partial [Oscillospiraceae bacterium]
IANIIDSRIRIITTENHGQGSARNLGIKLAKGKYVGFVDGDDIIEESMYEVMLEKICDAEVCQCNILDVYPDGRYTKQLFLTNETVTIENRKKYFNEYIFNVVHSYECCNKLLNRQFLIDNNIWFGDNTEVYSEDLLFNLELAKKINKIVFIDKPFYHYFQSEFSHSKINNIEKVLKLCKLFEMVFEEEYKYELAPIAVLIIMINLSHVDGDYSIILKRKDIEKYLKLSFVSMKKLRHKLIMFLLLILPVFLKKVIIKWYYTNFR